MRPKIEKIHNRIMDFIRPIGDIIKITEYIDDVYRFILNTFSESHKKCKHIYNGEDQSICIKRIKIQLKQNKIKLLQKLKSSCSTSKNVIECNNRLMGMIKTLENEIALINTNSYRIHGNKWKTFDMNRVN